jgi:hypothetical protein
MVFITTAALGLAAVLIHSTGERLELRRLSHESPAWPRVRGEIVDTRLVWSSSPRAGKSYWPTIHYRYSVGAIRFLGDRVSFRPSYNRSEAEDAVSRFPARSTPAVWYRPGDPARSVLEPDTWRAGRATILLVPITVATSLLALVCLAVLLFVSKPRR